MRSGILALGLGAFTLVVMSAAPARAQDEYGRSAVYLIAQGSNNIGGFRGNPESGVVKTDTDHAFGASGALGYRINDIFAAEISGDWESGWEADVGPTKESEDILGGAVTANVRAYLGTDRLQPYGVLGLGIGFFEIRHNNTPKLRKAQADLVLRFGGGLDYWFNDQIGATMDVTYLWPTGASGKIDDLDYVKIGWGFILKFGGD